VGNIFNADFRDFLVALNSNEVEYLIVGGYAVILYGYSRTTGDLDIWVNKTEINYELLSKAFYQFKMPLMGLTKEKFMNDSEFDVFTYGRPPVCIDIMTSVKGLNFNEAFSNSKVLTVDAIDVKIIDYHDLITAKKACGRHKDIDDIENIS
jgi:predicted nucleotidyltransferase